MSLIPDANPEILAPAFSDLAKNRRTNTGRNGLKAEEVLRCALLNQSREFTYDDLEYYLADPFTFRSFVKLNMGQYPGKSSLQSNIKALSEKTWIAIYQFITSYANKKNLENGRKIRKVFLTGGSPNLTLDCLIENGNPADSDRFQQLLDRQKDYYNRPPRQTTTDGGFASKNILAYAKEH